MSDFYRFRSEFSGDFPTNGAMNRHTEAVSGDITAETTDVVVNAANSELARGAGVCGAIFAAAGPGLAEACAALGGCATGDAKATPGFGLAARWVVHAVGPIWQGGDQGEPELLASAYRRSLEVAEDLGASSIALPAISTGIYGYPLDAATAIAVATCRDTPARHLELVRFICFDAETLRVYEDALCLD